ncbi:MAG TPA: hypothetical protein VMJ73_12140 [Rhizomicrobium sp.]|nr:hypothetical protein [Rhizomicrobium sp.]
MNWWNVFGRLSALEAKVNTIMSTEADLQADLDAIKADFTTFTSSVATSLQNLKDQIATLQAGQPVSQAQLDALVTEAAAIDAAIKAAPTS